MASMLAFGVFLIVITLGIKRFTRNTHALIKDIDHEVALLDNEAIDLQKELPKLEASFGLGLLARYKYEGKEMQLPDDFMPGFTVTLRPIVCTICGQNHDEMCHD